MDMNRKRQVRKENKGVREETNLKKEANINWVVGIYGRTALKSVFIKAC